MLTLKDLLEKNDVLLSDGAWGTMFIEKGLIAGACPEPWNIDRPDDVYDIAKQYVEAGSKMVGTNSFGGSTFKMSYYGFEDKVKEINEMAAKLSRKAMGDNGIVIGSVGPTGKILMMGDVTEEELYDSFKLQAIALEKGGANAICIETMSAIDEAEIAVKAAKENTNLEIITTFSFEKTIDNDYKTMMGVDPLTMANAMLNAGADYIGANCGNGIEDMVEIVKIIRYKYPIVPILVHANAGVPELRNGETFFPDGPESMSNKVASLIDAGANMIGGCCGTTPEHIKYINQSIKAICV